ncbi:sialidase family protein [Dokdonia sp. R86516]|uniref:sialidase family protein n=1 Tax=Dokdonia sp. R86516 TaxID=3093856 RepID=UPI0037C8BD66
MDYHNNGKSQFKVHLKEPIKVYEAKKEQPWGFVQFPKIFNVLDGRIAVTWSMNPDDISANNKYGWKYSNDSGKKWTFKWNDRPYMIGHLLPNGDYLKMLSLFSKENQMTLPSPYLTKKENDGKIWRFYERDDVPDKYLGFVQNRIKRGSDSVIREKVPKNNFKVLSYSQNGIFAQQAWGKIKATKDGYLLKCINPGFYKNGKGGVSSSSVDFYISYDDGECWDFQGSIPSSKENHKVDKNRLIGFQEPTFEVLANGDLICIMRSSPNYLVGDMFQSISNDKGKSWSDPVKITSNGVLPQLEKLNNGIVVLSSGRPGVQVRFSLDSLGVEWSEPFEMMRYHGLSGQVSCGYTGILPISDNSFLLIYSYFRNRDENNNIRKAIFVREIEISKS